MITTVSCISLSFHNHPLILHSRQTIIKKWAFSGKKDLFKVKMIIFWWTRLNISARKSRSFEWLEAHVRSCSAASRWLCPSLALTTTTTTTTTTRWNSLSKVKILNLEWKKKFSKKYFQKMFFLLQDDELGPKKPDRLKLKKKLARNLFFGRNYFLQIKNLSRIIFWDSFFT